MTTCITIYTDASVCIKTQKGGWACWVKYGPNSKLEYSGAFKHPVTNSTDAEMRAIANALKCVITQLKPTDAILVVTTDSQNAIKNIEGFPPADSKRRRQAEKKNAHLRALGQHIREMVPEGCTLRMKKVKAHSNKDGVRSYVNSRVDHLAKQEMRRAREATWQEVPHNIKTKGKINAAGQN